MASDRGYLTADGRVVRSRRPDVIGTVSYKELRYNLRRVYVTREWIVRLNDGRRFIGSRRRDAIFGAIAAHREDHDTAKGA